jgi:hypothetical protein
MSVAGDLDFPTNVWPATTFADLSISHMHCPTNVGRGDGLVDFYRWGANTAPMAKEVSPTGVGVR